MDTLVTLLVGFLILCIWLMPTFCSRENENAHKIAWLNFFLGWIPLVWLVLLLAALLGRKNLNNKNNKNNFF